MKHPALLILDEPLQGLDPINRQLVRRFVDILIGEGDTQLLFVSHHADSDPRGESLQEALRPTQAGYADKKLHLVFCFCIGLRPMRELGACNLRRWGPTGASKKR